jgi:uncharacterized membrane protein
MNSADMTIQPQKRKPGFNPASLFLIFGLLIGGAYSIFIPYGAGFDEEQHVARVFDIAGIHFLPNRSGANGTPIYIDFIALSYQRRYFQSPALDLLSSEKFLKPVDKEQMVDIRTRSIYPPFLFFPQAVLARFFWLKFDFPVIPVNILMRITGLLLYIFASYITLRILPVGKWVFMGLALSPMALFQAATLNADGFTNAVSFLFIGLVLKIVAEDESPIQPWKAWALAGACLLLGFAKPTSIFLLPLLLILPLRRFQSKTMLTLIGLGAVLAVVFTGVYSLLSISGSHFSDTGDMSLSRQLPVVLSNPLDFMVSAVKGNILAAGDYFVDWVGVYGHWDGAVPGVVYWLYPLVLIGALLVEPRSGLFSKKIRIYMLSIFLAGSAVTVLMYSYAHYTPDELASLGQQGRYFIFIAPLLYIPLVGLATVGEKWRKLTRFATASLLAAVLLFYSAGIYATYYTVCGSSYYTFKPCTQPIYKNLDASSLPEASVNSGSSITQEFKSVCGKLTAARILVKSVPPGSSGSLRFSLQDNIGQVVSAREFAVASIQLETWLTLPVAPRIGRVNPKYLIRLETQDLLPAPGLGVALSKSNQYRDGELTVGKKKVTADLIFQYSCISPWQSVP